MSGHLELANGTRVAIVHGFVLGRVAGCDLVIDDGKASRKHARFHVEGGVVEIEDLQSSNGTLLNDKPVTRRLLRAGDRIQIGKTVLVFRDGEVPGSGAARPASAAASLDDNDLFGDGPTEVGLRAPAAAAPSPTPAAPPPTVPVRATPPPPPPTPPKPAVVEFADEVVEVKKAAPPPEREPEIAVAPRAKATAGTKAEATVTTGSRILQFQNKPGGRGGLMGDDLGQLSGGMRTLLMLGALALGAGIVYGIVVLTS